MCEEVSRNVLTTILAKIYEHDMAICDQDGTKISQEKAVSRVIQTLFDSNGDSAQHKKMSFKNIKKIEKQEKVQFPFMPSIVNYYTPQCCQGVKKANGLYVVCGTHVKEGQFCKTCVKVPNQREEFERRMTTSFGKFNKMEMGLATVLAKQKSKETKSKEDIEAWVYAEVDRRIRLLEKIPDDIDEYHRDVDWSRINLSGKRGRPKKPPKPVVSNVQDIGTMVREDDIIAQLIRDAEPYDEEKEDEESHENPEENTTEAEEEEEIEVIKLKYKDGKTYYLQETTCSVYNEKEELVGRYDKVLKRIEFSD